jgi:hypothetical protein
VAAFPIMMGACAILMPVAGTRFVLAGRQRVRAALGLTLGGLPAVLIAALIVKSLPLDAEVAGRRRRADHGGPDAPLGYSRVSVVPGASPRDSTKSAPVARSPLVVVASTL